MKMENNSAIYCRLCIDACSGNFLGENTKGWKKTFIEEYEFDNVDAVCELLNTKYKRYAGDEKGIKKTVAALQRLGYNWSDIKSALQRTGFETEDFYND